MKRVVPLHDGLPATPASLSLAAAHELGEAGETLAYVHEAPAFERVHYLVLLEHAHAAASAEDRLESTQRRVAAAAAREDRDG